MRFTISALFASLMFCPAIIQAEPEDHHDHDHHADEHAEHREHAAHVHGKGRLTLAIQDNTLEIMLESPADSLFGFEHAPTTPTEQAHASKILAQLKETSSLFKLDTAARCDSKNVEIDAPFALDPKASGDGHADVSATYSFECKHPKNLTTLSLPVLKVFPDLRTLTVDYVTDDAQGSQTVTSDQPALKLK